jgi:hypothetical protein
MIEDKNGTEITTGTRVMFPYGGDLHIAVATEVEEPDFGPAIIRAAVIATAPAGLCQVISDDQQAEVPSSGQTIAVGGIAP